MIYCGSGSYFGKVLVAVPVPVMVTAQDPDLFSTVFPQQKGWPLIIDFQTFFITLRFRSAKSKSCSSGSSSGSTTVTTLLRSSCKKSLFGGEKC
jgi:hypothetical protein